MAWVCGCTHTPGKFTHIRVSLTMTFSKIGLGSSGYPAFPTQTINYVSARVPKKRGIRHKNEK